MNECCQIVLEFFIMMLERFLIPRQNIHSRTKILSPFWDKKDKQEHEVRANEEFREKNTQFCGIDEKSQFFLGKQLIGTLSYWWFQLIQMGSLCYIARIFFSFFFNVHFLMSYSFSASPLFPIFELMFISYPHFCSMKILKIALVFSHPLDQNQITLIISYILFINKLYSSQVKVEHKLF